MARVTGTAKIVAELHRRRLALAGDLQRVSKATADELKRNLKARTMQPFQSVPTYIYETERQGRHGGPGKYPPGTIGFFATLSASIAGTPWEALVQLYSDLESRPEHKLHTMVDAVATTDGVEYLVEAGYPEEVPGPRGSPYRYIYWVLSGTTKMQRRPFLDAAQEDVMLSWLLGIEGSLERFVGAP